MYHVHSIIWIESAKKGDIHKIYMYYNVFIIHKMYYYIYIIIYNIITYNT